MKKLGLILAGALPFLSGCLFTYQVSQYDFDVVGEIPSRSNQRVTLCAEIKYIDAATWGGEPRTAVKEICETDVTDSKGRFTVNFSGKAADWSDTIGAVMDMNSSAHIEGVKFYIAKSGNSPERAPVSMDVSRLRQLDRLVDGTVGLKF